MALALLFGAVSAPLWAQQASTKDWSVAVLDRILSNVQPGQKLAQVGDMEIPVTNLRAWRNQLAGVPSPQSIFDTTVPLWTNGNLYYTFDPSVSQAHQKAFLDAANEWAIFANLHFFPRTTQSNYFTVLENAGLEGGQSALGMVGGQQFLQIGPSSWNRGTICHELGHTLGLFHEQQRTDRDNYVVILTNNISPGQEGNFIILTNSHSYGAYDFQSVMHYARNALSISNTLDTIEPQPAYIQFLNLMGHSDPVLTSLDRAGMGTVYGAGPTPSPVVTNTQDSGGGSLRAAIYYGYDHPNSTVTFNIPVTDPGFSNNVFNIQPTDQLPALVHGTIIDGSSEPTNSNPNGPSILINGNLAPPPSVFPTGLHLTGSNCVVRSLIINGFVGFGIYLDGANAFSNTVSGCYLGINPAGTAAATNNGSALVLIANGASRNTIGGTNAAARNVIGGSPYQGLVIEDSGTHSNVVQGNYLGVNAAGSGAVPNGYSGFSIFGGAQANVIGPGNVISGNSNQGGTISDPDTTGNIVKGNYIGLGPAGTNAIPNAWSGLDIFGGAQSNLVGGTSPSARNVISGNTLQGVTVSGTNSSANIIQGNYLGLGPGGTNAIGNGGQGVAFFNHSSSNWIGGIAAGARNVISGNNSDGVALQDSSMNNVVQGNYIGLDWTGAAAVPNANAGVAIEGGAQWNLVGGTIPGAANVISGNGAQGVSIFSSNTAWNTVQGNLIGLNAAGTGSVGNNFSGVGIFSGCQSNILGGPLPSMRNIISGNLNQGILIADTNTANNLVQGNFIGVNTNGTAAISNAWAGVEVYNGPVANIIGGTTPAIGNVISGNGLQGVFLHEPGTSNNLVQGNFIGLGAGGYVAIPNGFAGVELYNGTQGNLIGGGPGARNYISGNDNYGVAIDFGSAGNFVQGNSIGLNVTNGPAPNLYAGVAMFAGALSNQVGGAAGGLANTIAFNLSDGIDLYDAATTNNSLRGNSLFSNTGLGINLINSANLSAPAPVLSNAVLTTSLSVTGKLTSTPNATFHLDFYASPLPAASAQATVYLGAKDVLTSAGGTVNFTANFGVIPAGRVITATATDLAGNTSPLSAGVTITATDSVGDGIPNAWRAAHFGGNGTSTNSQSCATCDPDHDGMNNLQEFRAGTDPTNAASVFKMLPPLASAPDITARFQSVTGIVYRVQYRDDLATGTWSVLADDLLGNGSLLQVTNPGAATLPKRFYRAQVVP